MGGALLIDLATEYGVLGGDIDYIEIAAGGAIFRSDLATRFGVLLSDLAGVDSGIVPAPHTIMTLIAQPSTRFVLVPEPSTTITLLTEDML